MNPKHEGKAPFFVLEGIDGAGTTTHARRLVAFLQMQGLDCLPTAEPTDGPVGRLIREYLAGKHTEDSGEAVGLDPTVMTLLFCADRAEHLSRRVLPALHSGTAVVSDRYYYSTVCYQSVGCDADWVRQTAAHAPRPDLTLLLDVEPKTGLERVGGRGNPMEAYEKLDFLERVRENYLTMFADAPEVRVLDAGRPLEEVAAEIRQQVESWLKEAKRE